MKTVIHAVKAENGITFLGRRVNQGDKYGLNDCLTHDKADPLIEFYDTRYLHTQYGQFVSRYYLSTLLKCHASPTRGLDMQGDVADWKIDGTSLNAILNALTEV